MRMTKRTQTKTSLGLCVLIAAADAPSAAAQPEAETNQALLIEQQLYGSKSSQRYEPAPSATESFESLASRVREARIVAAEQRRAALASMPSTEGLTQSQLEIRAGEQNLITYDLQVLRGEATPVIQSFRRLAVSTLAELRRKELWRLWGNAIYHPEAFDVLSEHGRTMAELRRVQSLARRKRSSSVLQQSDELVRQENLAFEREMRRLRDEVRDNPSFARLSIELHEQAERDARK
jgi:hypothetical protein